jgi:putative heme-binding domain-containing protein
VNLVCQRGSEEALAYVYERAIKPDGFPGDVRRQTLEGLAAAAQIRKIYPTANADGLKPLLANEDPRIRRAALRLAATWRPESLAPVLSDVALAPASGDESRRLALDALVAMGGDSASETIDKLLTADVPRSRTFGIVALAGIDIDKAAERAAAMIGQRAMATEIDLLVGAFLARQGGTEKLAAALAAAPVPADAAKLALRSLYLAGRSDLALVDVLRRAAGIEDEKPPPTPDELRALSAEVLAKGDPARGEVVFRRADLGCMKCHAVSGAGGDVGPDLSPVGSTSPVDYCITSILQPDLSIKESFLTRHFVTTAGMIHQGIVVDRDDKRVIVKDAAGERITIPTADIEDEVEGKSLMPKGLSAFLTREEFLDLVRFISELGKPGPYAVRSQPTIQRWRYLNETPPSLAEKVPAAADLAREVLSTDPNAWAPAYGCVGGSLPLAELAAEGRKVLYLFGEVEVTQPGQIEINVDDRTAVTTWVDDKLMADGRPAVAALDAGLHRITLRIGTAQRQSKAIRVTVDKPAASTAVYTVVGGR